MRRVLCVAATVLAVVALAACGTSSSSKSSSGTSSSSGGAAATAAPKGTPILFGSVTTVNNPTVSNPGIFAALKAGAAAVNKAGGINGHPVKIWTCNAELNPSVELACARKAVAAGVIAMVGDGNALASFKTYGGILSSAGIADVSNTGPFPNGFEGSNTFPVTWPLSEFVPCTSPELAKIAGGKKVVDVTSSGPDATTLVPLFEGITKAVGLTFVKNISVPVTTSDYSSTVAAAEQSGANIVEMLLLGGGPEAFVRASSEAGAHYVICTAAGLTGEGGWGDAGSEANKLYIGGDFKPLTANVPGMKRFLSEMAAGSASGDSAASTSPTVFQDETMETWLGLQAAVQAAKTIQGPVTRTTFLAAMKKAKVSFGGIVPPVNFAAPAETPGATSLPFVQAFQHVWQSTAYLWKWVPTENNYTLTSTYPDTFKTAVAAK
jgi:branched-chain amino acid transport system substrate-binding protein